MKIAWFPSDLLVLFLQRGWQGLAGLLTLTLLITSLSNDELGIYYSFLSIAGVSTLVDLGLGTVLLHKISRLIAPSCFAKENNLVGAQSDAVYDLISFSIHFYKILSVFFLVMLLIFGTFFFKTIPGVDDTNWLFPWISLCVFTSVSLLLIPFFALVEASGRISEVYTVRLLQGLAGSFLCWITLLANGGLWAVVSLSLGFVSVGFIWVFSKYREIFVKSWKFRSTSSVNIRDLWSFQWRVGIGMICSYIQLQIISPILLTTQGPDAAGKIGVGLTVINMIALITQPWLVRKVPELAKTAAARRYGEMDKLFLKSISLTIIFYTLGVLIAIFCIYLLFNTLSLGRILDLTDFLLLSMCVLFNIISGSVVIYFRSFNVEPFIKVTVLSTIIIAVFGYISAAGYSVRGYLTVLLFVNAVLVFPTFIYGLKSFRRELLQQTL